MTTQVVLYQTEKLCFLSSSSGSIMLGRLCGKRPPNAKAGVTNNSWQYVPLIMLALESQGILSDTTNW